MADLLAQDIKNILISSQIEENSLRLTCGDLGEMYQKVDAVLKRCGAKWNTKQNCHVFERGTATLKLALETEQLPPMNPMAFFPTPTELAFQCLEDAGFCSGWDNVLEPSAGQGSFLKLMRDEYDYTNEQLTVIEYDPFNCLALREEGFDPIQIDFMDYKPDKEFDSVVMNPPFSIPGISRWPVYMNHFLHAYKMWNGNGCFIAIVPPVKILNHCFDLPKKELRGTNIRGSNMEREFQEIIEQEAHVHMCPDGAFKRSGTGTSVQTAFVMIPGG